MGEIHKYIPAHIIELQEKRSAEMIALMLQYGFLVGCPITQSGNLVPTTPEMAETLAEYQRKLRRHYCDA